MPDHGDYKPGLGIFLDIILIVSERRALGWLLLDGGDTIWTPELDGEIQDEQTPEEWLEMCEAADRERSGEY